MKKAFLLLTLILLSSFKDIHVNKFDNEVEKSYDQYRIIHEYSNINYTIKLIHGTMKDNVYYGICFYSEMAKEYTLRLDINGREYELKGDDRGDISVIALDLNRRDMFSLVVYDKNNNMQALTVAEFSDIHIPSKDEFENYENILPGFGKGSSLSKPSYVGGIVLTTITMFFIIAGSILFLCVVIIFIYFKKRKGLFNKDERKKNVFNFKEFIYSVEQSLKEEENEHFIPTEVIEDQDEEPTLTHSPEYTPHYSWARSEEETSNFNVKKHLQSKGFIINYTLASDEEKNQITMELMHLRDSGIITKDDYLDEIGKLWK